MQFSVIPETDMMNSLNELLKDAFQKTESMIKKITEIYETSKFLEHEPYCIVTLDGLIGAGKSTLLDDLVSFRPEDFYVSPEPVEEWQEALEEFYAAGEDKSAVAFKLQTRILDCLERRLIKVFSDPEINNKIVVLERDASSCKIFMECTKNSFTFEQKQDINLQIAYQQAILSHLPRSCGHFHAFLDADAEECLRRIKSRARPGEEHINLEYLLRLQEQQLKAFTSYHLKVYDGQGPYQEVGFDRVKGLIKPFAVPSGTSTTSVGPSKAGREKRVKRFAKHISFIMRLHCLTGQLRQFQ